MKDSKEEASQLARMKCAKNASYDKMQKQKLKNYFTTHGAYFRPVRGYPDKIEDKQDDKEDH